MVIVLVMEGKEKGEEEGKNEEEEEVFKRKRRRSTIKRGRVAMRRDAYRNVTFQSVQCTGFFGSFVSVTFICA